MGEGTAGRDPEGTEKYRELQNSKLAGVRSGGRVEESLEK